MKLLCTLLLLVLALSAQTRVGPNQIRLTIAVVEWAKCVGQGPGVGGGPGWNCNGLELYRFKMSDGSMRGPFVAVLAPSDLVIDSKWQEQSLPEGQ